MATKEDIIVLVKNVLGIDPTDTSIDPLLGNLLEQVITEVESLTGAVIGRTEEAEEYLLVDDGAWKVIVSRKPVVSLAAVEDYETGEDLTEECKVWDAEKGIIGLVSPDDSLPSVVRVVYTAGYEDIPGWLASILMKGVLNLYGKTDMLKQGASRISTPDGTIVFSDSGILPDSDIDLLKRKFIPITIGG